MIRRSRLLLFPQKLIYPAFCRRNQLSPFGFARSSHTSAISRHAKLGWSLASLLGIVAVGCSWHQLNLDAAQDTSSTRDIPREPRRPTHDGPAGSVYVRYPRAYMHTSEQTVFPGDHTGIARYDTAHSDSTSNPVTDFSASVLPVPSGYWSIFALLSSADPRPADHEALSWTQRNIVPAVAGALADVHPANCPPPNTHIDDALRHALARLDTDARTGVPWARHASPASTLLAFFDSESRVLRIANTGTGRAFLGRRVGDNHECREIAGSCAVRYLEPVQSRAIEVEELVDEGLFPPRGFLDVASVEVQSVEVRDGDFLVLGSDSTWASLAGDQAVQAVSAWMREQEVSIPERPGRDGRFLEGPLLDVPWKEEQGLVSGLVRAMVPGMIWDIDKMFVGGRGNAASHVLWRTELKHRAEGSSHGAPDQDRPVAGRTRHTTSCSNNCGSVMVVMFADGQSSSKKPHLG